MKKVFFIVVICSFFIGMGLSVQAQSNKTYKIGDIMSTFEKRDEEIILVKENKIDNEIYSFMAVLPTYIVNEELSICIEDLVYCGYDMHWDPKKRITKFVSKKVKGFEEYEKDIHHKKYKGAVLYSDIKIYVDEKPIKAYNIGGYSLVSLKDLKKVENLKWKKANVLGTLYEYNIENITQINKDKETTQVKNKMIIVDNGKFTKFPIQKNTKKFIFKFIPKEDGYYFLTIYPNASGIGISSDEQTNFYDAKLNKTSYHPSSCTDYTYFKKDTPYYIESPDFSKYYQDDNMDPNYQINFHKGVSKYIKGKIILPDGEVAPKEGLEVKISVYEFFVPHWSHLVEDEVMIEAGKNSATYKILCILSEEEGTSLRLSYQLSKPYDYIQEGNITQQTFTGWESFKIDQVVDKIFGNTNLDIYIEHSH
ncbi:hypothetical protein [Inediibacterium massiliense]|uniref:hypothetical protein n=1 Tax=Inediibacterium massiliense TaxID=1658111 RepID=UPI0006B47264|nr:hypothetical protein [Inediibacterium massiliense]